MIGGNKPELTKISFDQQLITWSEVTIDNGLSVVAIDSTNGKVVGGFTSMDAEAMPGFCAIMKSIGHFYDTYKLMPRVGEFIEVINQLNEDLSKEIDQIVKINKLKNKKNILCEMAAVGVHKDYTGRGIAKELTNCLLQNSKNKGFFISKAECSSLFSTKALTKNGAVVEKSADYETFTIKGGCCSKDYQPFKGLVGDIHKNANLVVFRHFPEGMKEVKKAENKEEK